MLYSYCIPTGKVGALLLEASDKEIVDFFYDWRDIAQINFELVQIGYEGEFENPENVKKALTNLYKQAFESNRVRLENTEIQMLKDLANELSRTSPGSFENLLNKTYHSSNMTVLDFLMRIELLF
jgi:hypothetical protein